MRFGTIKKIRAKMKNLEHQKDYGIVDKIILENSNNLNYKSALDAAEPETK